MLSKQVFLFQKMMQSQQIIASLFSNSFEHVSNMMGPGVGLGWVEARPVLNSLVWAGLGWAGLAWPGLAWAGLGWPGLAWANKISIFFSKSFPVTKLF